jgi:thiosulfate/3-mercaptopyruvate sulfurtransferase
MKMTKFFFLITLSLCSFISFSQLPENWTKDQLLEPSELAGTINSKKDVPVILSVGPGAIIPGSINMGMVSDTAVLKKFRAYLTNLPKDKKVIIYCGCCPFNHCPNVRPAIDVLKEKGFTNYYLLNLPHNIKIDWIDEGYPVVK